MLRLLRLAVCPLLVAGALLQGGEAILPLPVQSSAAAAITQALITLSRGDVTLLEALPSSAFTAPIAIADEGDADVQRRWTAALPATLARLDGAGRERALASLDRLYRAALAAQAEPDSRARLAADFLPAPAAVAELAAAGDRAFDHGHLEDFLGIARLLAVAGQPPRMAAKREQVAMLLSGRGPDVDASLTLAPPGAPQPTAARPSSDSPRLAVAWVATPGWLLACDPWGQVQWQYRIDRSAEIHAGAGAALVKDSEGLRVVTDDGAIAALGSLPQGARVLAVAGGAAWFATGRRAWRLELPAARIQALDLDGEPLSAPLVRGPQSLWLTARELLLFDGDRLLGRLRHGLAAAPGWRLDSEHARPLVVGADGHAWRLESLGEQLLHAQPVERARLLVQAARYEEALAALAGRAEADSAAGRRYRLHAHLGLGCAHVAEHLAEVRALAQDAQEEALVDQAAWQGATGAEARSLRASLETAIAELAHREPDVVLSPCSLGADASSDFTVPPTDWPVALSGSGYLRALAERAGAAPPDIVLATPVVGDAVTATGAAEERRQSDGSTRYRQRLIRLTTRIDRKELRCSALDGTLLWWHCWEGLPSLSAPASLVTCRGDAVLVIEGQQRLHAVALASGTLLASVDLDDGTAASGDFAVLGSGSVALLGPLGLDTRLTLSGAQPLAIELPAPGRWLMALDGRAVVALQDGRVLAYPGATPVALPSAVREAAVAPCRSLPGC